MPGPAGERTDALGLLPSLPSLYLGVTMGHLGTEGLAAGVCFSSDQDTTSASYGWVVRALLPSLAFRICSVLKLCSYFL